MHGFVGLFVFCLVGWLYRGLRSVSCSARMCMVAWLDWKMTGGPVICDVAGDAAHAQHDEDGGVRHLEQAEVERDRPQLSEVRVFDGERRGARTGIGHSQF